jgi:hypothetical protein
MGGEFHKEQFQEWLQTIVQPKEICREKDFVASFGMDDYFYSSNGSLMLSFDDFDGTTLEASPRGTGSTASVSEMAEAARSPWRVTFRGRSATPVWIIVNHGNCGADRRPRRWLSFSRIVTLDDWKPKNVSGQFQLAALVVVVVVAVVVVIVSDGETRRNFHPSRDVHRRQYVTVQLYPGK